MARLELSFCLVLGGMEIIVINEFLRQSKITKDVSKNLYSCLVAELLGYSPLYILTTKPTSKLATKESYQDASLKHCAFLVNLTGDSSGN